MNLVRTILCMAEYGLRSSFKPLAELIYFAGFLACSFFG